jgi:hypothetical protein
MKHPIRNAFAAMSLATLVACSNALPPPPQNSAKQPAEKPIEQPVRKTAPYQVVGRVPMREASNGAIAVHDMNGDGLPDIVTMIYVRNRGGYIGGDHEISIFYNDGHGNYNGNPAKRQP